MEKEQLQLIANNIINWSTNYSKEAKKLGISDNGLRKKIKNAWIVMPVKQHLWKYHKKCVMCWTIKLVEHNDLKDYKTWGLLKNTYCSKFCKDNDYKRVFHENNNVVWNKWIKMK
jgi:hypothetical protein